MNPIISGELDKLRFVSESLVSFEGEIKSVFRDDFVRFIRSEVLTTVDIIISPLISEKDKRMKMIKVLGRLNGIEKAIDFLNISSFESDKLQKVFLFRTELTKIEESLIKILMNYWVAN